MKTISIFFSAGFRPFFLAAATMALLNMVIWIGYLSGVVELHSEFTPSMWHLHEMMFGFVGAAIAGFLLTAVPNWTGRPNLRGLNLASLFALWTMGRVASFYSSYTGIYFAAIADLPFFFILGIYIYKEILATGNHRNLPIAIMVSMFGVANVIIYAEYIWGFESAHYGYRFSILLISLLVMLIGGRIIPNFTANWLKQQGSDIRPTLMGKFDIYCIAASLFGLLSWVLMPDNIITGFLILIIGFLNAVRFSRWQMAAIFNNHMLLILQIAYLWLAVGLLALGVYIIFQIEPLNMPIHALTIGAFTTMILGVMTRASLGHTGRKVAASKLTLLIFLSIQTAVVSRILATYTDMLHDELLYVSAVAWVLSFAVFIIEYAPYFLKARK
ncbi:MAG: NnrS family protein [Hyphomicrobiales bacterium]